MRVVVRYLSGTSGAFASKVTADITNGALGSSKKRLRNVLSLEEFLFRQRVKQIYRDVLRIIYKSHEKTDLLEFTKGEFNVNAKETDLNHRKYLLHLGIKRINEMTTMLGINGPEFK